MDQGNCPKCGESVALTGLTVGDLVSCSRCGETCAAWEAAARRAVRGAAPTLRAAQEEPLPLPPPLPITALREGNPPPIPPALLDDSAATTRPATDQRPQRGLSARRVARWLVLGAVVATLIIVALWIFRPRTRTSGLEHVPGDAAAFVSVKVGEWWKGPLAEKTRTLFGADIDKALQEACGLDVQDIERVTVVLPRLAGKDAKPDLWAIVKTAKPYDAARIRAGFADNVTEHTHNAKTYFAGPAGAVHFLGKDLLVLGTADGVKDFLTRDGATAGPLRAGIPLAESHDVVLAVRDPWAREGSFDAELARWPTINALRAAPLAVMTVNAGHNAASFDLRIDLADEAGAKTVESELVDWTLELRRKGPPPWTQLNVSRSENKVTLSGKDPEPDPRHTLFDGKHFSVNNRSARDVAGVSRRTFNDITFHGTYIGCNFNTPDDPRLEDWGRLATTYYARKGPAGIVMEKFNWWPGPPNNWAADARLPASLPALAAPGAAPLEALAAAWSEPPYAVVGLNVGTMASYARPYQPLHFYVPHPELIELSVPKDGKKPFFRFLRDASERGVLLDLRPGEPRRLLSDSKTDGFYHALFIDTYRAGVETLWEDLLTKEGMELCLRKLAPGGILCYHVSNRYFELEPVVADVAASLGCVCRLGRDFATAPEADAMEHMSSSWVMVARREADLLHLKPPPGHRPLFPREEYWSTPRRTGAHVWTDAARPFAGLHVADPMLYHFKYSLFGRLKRYPGIPKSEAAHRVLDEAFPMLDRFLVANRNKK